MRSLILSVAVLCGLAGQAVAQQKPVIVAVNYALQDFAERLAGDAAEVVFPVPDGVDPSFWRPTIAEISAVQSADLILLNGAGFAAWTTKVTLPRARIVDTGRGLEDRLIATESITHSHGDGGEHSHEGLAAYTWLDPALARLQAAAIGDALAARGIVAAEDLEARRDALETALSDLDDRARAALAGAGDTVFVATHPRYQYLARAYGLKILSLDWEAGAAPTDPQIEALRALKETEGAAVLIWEATPPPDARARIADLGLEDAVFAPLARNPGGAGFAEAFAAAVEDLAAAAARAAAR